MGGVFGELTSAIERTPVSSSARARLERAHARAIPPRYKAIYRRDHAAGGHGRRGDELAEGTAPYIGSLHQGHHLATSRRTTGWPDSAATLPLGNLSTDDATTLLCRLVFKDTEPTPQQRVNARALVADLGCLPLAVKQVGAYLAQNRGVSLDA
ncbi:hypothetical protein [Streptomyces cyslabdanicus]|uniref:hypothetical protein n=1 Tax=Streptomyces cyslabdanicus TaxID=1470456 RepID=UPI0040443AE0